MTDHPIFPGSIERHTTAGNRRIPGSGTQLFAVLATLLAWAGLRLLFWTGCVGLDDLLYIFYAHEFYRPPIGFWEFRMATVLPTHLILETLGPAEAAVVLPSLIGSFLILLAVAAFVDWPRVLNWRTSGAVLLAAAMPLDVTMASYLVPTMIAAGLLALGTACLLRGTRRPQQVGAALLALAVWSHEMSVFYVAALSAACLFEDARRYLRPLAACFCIFAAITLIESGVYHAILDDAAARWHAAGTSITDSRPWHDRFGDSMLRYFLWPLQIAVFGKHFGFDLGLVFVSGAVVWRRLETPQRILLLTAFLYWFWLGYGTQIPWAYRPVGRSAHYYLALTMPIAILLPSTLALALPRHRRVACGMVAAALVFHVFSLAAGGRWGQSVEVSRELLAYARSHPETRFLADGNTVREMVFVNGMRLPANVAAVPTVDWDGDGDWGGSRPWVEPDALLLNYERPPERVETDFSAFVEANGGASLWRVPVRYKQGVAPLARLFGREDLAILSRGGEVLTVRAAPRATMDSKRTAETRGHGTGPRSDAQAPKTIRVG
jgi:hypothetical protein